MVRGGGAHDSEPVRIGRRTNVQDLCVLHADPGFPCLVGDEVTIGHGAIVHGARVADRVMIGMRAVVLNEAQIGEHSVIGAGAVVPEGMVVPPRSLLFGVPAKIRREVTADEIARLERAARHYVESSRRACARAEGVRLSPQRACKAGSSSCRPAACAGVFARGSLEIDRLATSGIRVGPVEPSGHASAQRPGGPVQKTRLGAGLVCIPSLSYATAGRNRTETYPRVRVAARLESRVGPSAGNIPPVEKQSEFS